MGLERRVVEGPPPDTEFDVCEVYNRKDTDEGEEVDTALPQANNAARRVDSVQRQFEKYLQEDNNYIESYYENSCANQTAVQPYNRGEICEVHEGPPDSLKDPTKKTRDSFRLSILDILNGDNAKADNYCSNWEDIQVSRRNFYISDDVHTNNHRNPRMCDMKESLSQLPYCYRDDPYNHIGSKESREPIISILGDYLPESRRPEDINKPRYSSPKHTYREEIGAEKSIITPPPSDLLLTAFKTASSDSVFSNLRRLALSEDQCADPEMRPHKIYEQEARIRANHVDHADNCIDECYSSKKSSFDPISALDEVLMLQNLEPVDNKFNTAKKNPVRDKQNNNDDGQCYFLQNIDNRDFYHPADFSDAERRFQRKSAAHFPPETNYDQKSTLMLTEIAGNIDDLYTFESDEKRDFQNNDADYPRRPHPHQRKSSLDSRDDDSIPNVNAMSDNVRYHERTSIADSYADDMKYDLGLEHLREKQYQPTIEKKAVNSRNRTKKIDKTQPSFRNNTNWENGKAGSEEIVTLRENGLPHTASSLKILKDLRQAFGGHPYRNIYGRRVGSSKRQKYSGKAGIKDDLMSANNSEITCSCPRVLRKFIKHHEDINGSGSLRLNSSNSGPAVTTRRNYTLREQEFPGITPTSLRGRNSHSRYNKLLSSKTGLSRSNSSKLPDRGNAKLDIGRITPPSECMQPITKPKVNKLISTISKIKSLFTKSNHSNNELEVLHRPHCTLTRSSSISKDSLPIIPSPRSSSFCAVPFQSILKPRYLKQQQDTTEPDESAKYDELFEDPYTHRALWRKNAGSEFNHDSLDSLYNDLHPKPPPPKETLSYNTHLIHRLPSPKVNHDNPKIPPPRSATRPKNLFKHGRLISPPGTQMPGCRPQAPPTINPPFRRRVPAPRPNRENYQEYYRPRIEDYLMTSGVCNNRQQVGLKSKFSARVPSLILRPRENVFLTV